MAGVWIYWQKGLARKPEVLAIARAVGWDRRQVAGALMEFWEWVDDNCVDGHVDALAPTDVATMLAGCTPEFINAMENVGWLCFDDRGLTIPNFERWMSRNAKVRLQKNERQAVWRKGNVDAPSSTRASTSVDVGAPTIEENRREEKNKEEEGGIRPQPNTVNLPSSTNTPATEPQPIAQPAKTFAKPSVDEVRAYCAERKNTVSAERFIDFYESKGWMVGKNKMKDWRAAVRTWEGRDGNGVKPADTGKEDIASIVARQEARRLEDERRRAMVAAELAANGGLGMVAGMEKRQ